MTRQWRESDGRKIRTPCGGAASPHLAAGEPLATATATAGEFLVLNSSALRSKKKID
jgi:hypothetical protein